MLYLGPEEAWHMGKPGQAQKDLLGIPVWPLTHGVAKWSGKLVFLCQIV